HDTLSSIAKRAPTLVVEVRGTAESVTQYLQDQPDVASVAAAPTAEPDLTAFQIKTKDRQDLREALSARLAGKGWGIRRLDLRRESLEDLFTAVVLRDGQAAAPAAEQVPAA